MELQLLISLDELADSFLLTLKDYDDKLIRKRYRSDLKFCCFKSFEWRAEESSDPLLELSNAILRKLGGADIQNVDIGFIMYANNNCIRELFIPLYERLEGFLDVRIITYRIFFIYPQPVQIKTLTEFRKNYTLLQSAVSETENNLREIHLMQAPKEKEDGGGWEWTKNQVESYLVLRNIASYLSNLDALFAGVKSPCCHSTHGRCRYIEETWKQYYKNRTIQDLTERTTPTNPDDLTEGIAKFSHSNLLFADGKIEFPPMAIDEIKIKDDLQLENSDVPLSESFEKYLKEEDSICRYIIEKNQTQIVKTKKLYKNLLKDIQGKQLTSLMGFEKALYAHRKMLKIAEERQVTLEPILNKKLIDVLNHFIQNIPRIGCIKLPATVKAEDCSKKVLESKVKEIQDALWSASGLSDEFTIIRNIFSKLLYNILKIMDTSEPEKIKDQEMESEIGNAVSVLDNLFVKIKDDFYNKKDLLNAHKKEHGFFSRLFSPSYSQKKNLIKNEIENIQKQYRHWGDAVNLFLGTLNNFLSLYAPWKLLSKLPLEEQLEEERNQLKDAGIYLEIFDKAISDVRSDVDGFISTIPKEPVMKENEMSFLCLPEFEKLYKKYKLADISKYLGNTTNTDDKEQDLWEQCFNRFIPRIDSHAESLFSDETLPKLNLTVLLSKYFPELRVSRIIFLIESLAKELIPLVQKNLKNRYYQMFYSSDSVLGVLLEDDKKNILYENRNVTLKETEFKFIENKDSNNLDLTINLTGFKVEEYLYWDAFVKKRGSDEN